MSESYYGCCGLCVNFDIGEKWIGGFYCSYYKKYFSAVDKACSHYERDGRKTASDVDYAREHN